MTTAAVSLPRIQHTFLFGALAVGAVVFAMAYQVSGTKAALYLIGLGLGVSLYHAAFGFTGAYKRALTEKDITGVTAQIIMIAFATMLFAPILAQQGGGGSVAPVSVSVAIGAFVFGVGMQMGSGCASGTLFAAGGGSVRMVLVLIFFCIGAFWGSLDLNWWLTLPSMGSVSLGKELGWKFIVPAQLAVLALIYWGLRRWGGENKRPLWFTNGGLTWEALLRGPWPLLMSAGLLALLNWLTLVIAGHAWSITWAFSLWAAKAATFVGWDSMASDFWGRAYFQGALSRSIFTDNTSVMNIGIILGATIAASLRGKMAPSFKIPPKQLASAVIGGLAMGYGARLAFGCNIGSLFSGIASTSLHGWLWIACAIPGNMVGIRLNKFFQSKAA